MRRTRNSPRTCTVLRSLRWLVALASVLACASLPASAPAQGGQRPVEEVVATFSIAAFDPETGDLGVAVQSKFFAVGRVVPFAAAGVGAIATQSYANTTFGPRGLEMLRRGTDPQATIERLLADDGDRDVRQLGIVGAAGSVASFTGDGCLPWAGAHSGEGYTAQGNLLAGPEVIAAMSEAFETSSGDLATRLVAALAAGQTAGGDIRGRQSAALLVVREGAGYGGFDDRYIDLRVDDHEAPIRELQRLLDIRHAMLAAERSRSLLEAAASNRGERASLLNRAVEEALSATALDEDDGWSWLTLAEALLASGDLGEAGAAGVRALSTDPWIKTAVLQGIDGSVEVIEHLLRDEAFRSAWEALPSR